MDSLLKVHMQHQLSKEAKRKINRKKKEEREVEQSLREAEAIGEHNENVRFFFCFKRNT